MIADFFGFIPKSPDSLDCFKYCNLTHDCKFMVSFHIISFKPYIKPVRHTENIV